VPADKVEDQQQGQDKLIDVFKLLVNRRMLYLLMTINMQYAISLGYWNALLPVFLKDCMQDQEWTDKQKNTETFFCMTMFALGAIAGSVLLGYVMDQKGPIHSVYVIIVVTITVQVS